MKNKWLLFPTIVGMSSSLIGIVSCGDNSPAVTLNFNECDWADIANSCEKLEEGEWTEMQFCQAFNFGKSKAKSLYDFVGQTRTLEMNGNDYQLIVIGVNQDTYGEDAHKATFTFEFKNLISDKDTGKYLTVDWESSQDKGNKNYWDGALEKALNNTDDVTWYTDYSGETVATETRSVYSMIKDSDPDNLWTNAIKSVNRTVNILEGSFWKPQEKNQPIQIFVPTLSNIFSKAGIEDDQSTVKELSEEYLSEGQKDIENKQYAFYANNIADHKVDKSENYDCLIRSDFSQPRPLSFEHFLSSPNLYGDDHMTNWYINHSGGLSTGLVGYVRAVAPCFCI